MTREQKTLQKTADVWLQARAVIVTFLRDMGHAGNQDDNAAALIARLAGADPPLLICTADEMKD